MLAVAALLAPSVGRPAEGPRAEFEEVCRQLRSGQQGYFGEAQAAYLAERLEQPIPDPLFAAALRFRYGRELLELGRPVEAIAALEANLGGIEGIEPQQLAQLLMTLGLAHLQAGEDENCVRRHSPDSCILPVRGGGVHDAPAHARSAAAVFLQLLRGNPENPVAAWLLNVAAMVAGDVAALVPEPFRLPAGAFAGDPSVVPWIDRAGDLGVAVVDLAGGAVMDDFDGDGLLDLVTSTSDPCGSLKGFRNDGRGGFEDVTAAWGLDEQLGGLNLTHADYDGDGRLDLLVLRGAWLLDYGRVRNSLLRNERRGDGLRFVDRTREAGVAGPAVPTQTAAWADYDGDGDLDLYVGNETSPDNPAPSQLFRNRGDGTFEEVAAEAGVDNRGYAKAVTWGDYDDDGDPDLFVSNIGPNRLFRNDGEGGFSEVAAAAGVTGPEGRSFASWFFDLDNDGDLDLFVADYDAPVAVVAAHFFGRPAAAGQPWVYRNEGGRFVEVSRSMGVTAPMLPMGANFGDVDNDGYPDVYLGTGDPEFESLFPNVLLVNRGGRRFEDATSAYRLGHLQKGHGVAFGDVDNDGDQDLFHQLGGFYPGDEFANALFENPGGGGRWITLRLEGRRANRFGIGARIEVRVEDAAGRRSVFAVAGSGGSFGGSSLQQEIGLGPAERILELIVRWPGSGLVQRFAEVEPDRFYRLVEGEERLEPLELPLLRLTGTPHAPHRHHVSGSGEDPSER